jgi:hypothetical protein
MSGAYRSVPGVYGPREIETLVDAYRSVLQEICDRGALSNLSHSSLSAREIRRLAAREVIVAASIGMRSINDLVARSVARIAADRTGR